MTGSDSIVEVRGLRKSFGRVKALKGVDLTVGAGEVVGLIGPNGAGKSTTLRILLGIIRASGGSAHIFGLDAWQQAIAIHRDLAYVPGDVYLWPNLTGGQIIDLLMSLHGHGQRDQRDRLIARFELDPSKRARTYSKGNRQKVALIATLACQAELYIFDEPTSGLDPLMEAVFRAEVSRLKAAGKAVLLSSHILSEVEQLADRVVVIGHGQVLEEGSLADLRQFTAYSYQVEAADDLTGLAALDGVSGFRASPGSHPGVYRASFKVDSAAVPKVLAVLVNHQVSRLESTPPTLEELFMSRYQAATESDGQPAQPDNLDEAVGRAGEVVDGSTAESGRLAGPDNEPGGSGAQSDGLASTTESC